MDTNHLLTGMILQVEHTPRPNVTNSLYLKESFSFVDLGMPGSPAICGVWPGVLLEGWVP